MHFTRVGNLFRVVRITGPSHNLLAIELQERRESSDDAVIEALPGKRRSTHLSATEVRESVLEGVAEANNEFGTGYCVRRIQFDPTDSPPAEVYRFLARSIVERLVTRGTWLG
jgi:hypothetical protein